MCQQCDHGEVEDQCHFICPAAYKEQGNLFSASIYQIFEKLPIHDTITLCDQNNYIAAIYSSLSAIICVDSISCAANV